MNQPSLVNIFFQKTLGTSETFESHVGLLIAMEANHS